MFQQPFLEQLLGQCFFFQKKNREKKRGDRVSKCVCEIELIPKIIIK